MESFTYTKFKLLPGLIPIQKIERTGIGDFISNKTGFIGDINYSKNSSKENSSKENSSSSSDDDSYEQEINYDSYDQEINYDEYDGKYDENEKTNPFRLITRRIDKNKVRYKNRKDTEVFVSQIKNINTKPETSVRSGAIIYTNVGSTTFFCLGIDAESGDITDFGGGVKKEETIVEGGLRELDEESQGIFGEIKINEIENETVVYCYNMAIMFIHLDLKDNTIINYREMFKDKIKNKSQFDLEVSDIIWMTSKELLDSINGNGKRMYTRVRKILYKAISVISEL